MRAGEGIARVIVMSEDEDSTDDIVTEEMLCNWIQLKSIKANE